MQDAEYKKFLHESAINLNLFRLKIIRAHGTGE